MKERFVAVETSSGRMETFVTHPEQAGPFPAVIIYMDIWGGAGRAVRDRAPGGHRRVLLRGSRLLLPPGQGAARVPRCAEPDDLAARARRRAQAAGDRARPSA